MSMKYLGDRFDIHTGGNDLRFPHHEDEIAQSEGAVGHQVVSIWVHGGHLRLSGQKIAKSTGNVVRVLGARRAGPRSAGVPVAHVPDALPQRDGLLVGGHGGRRPPRHAAPAPHGGLGTGRDRARRRGEGVRRAVPRGALDRPGSPLRRGDRERAGLHDRRARRREVRAPRRLGPRPGPRSGAGGDERLGADRRDARRSWPNATPPEPPRTSPRRTSSATGSTRWASRSWTPPRGRGSVLAIGRARHSPNAAPGDPRHRVRRRSE